MRIKKNISRNSVSYCIIDDVYVNGKRTTKVVENLGNDEFIRNKYNVSDAYAWALDYVQKLNDERKADLVTITKKYSNSKLLEKDVSPTFKGGYLFLQDIYFKLGLDKLCKDIEKDYSFSYSLSSVLSRLIYTRILYPSSKSFSYNLSKDFIESVDFSLHDVYRALDVIADNSDLIEEVAYKNSLNIIPRNTRILYFDCTNYFFEISDEKGMRKFGRSKEHRPNPIIQMGLFLDGSGLPLAFSIFNGNENEQKHLRPLEQRIIRDFSLSDIVVCTDSGLSSLSNRRFNNFNNRFFVTTQSLKKLPVYLKEWALSPDGFRLVNSDRIYSLDEIFDNQDLFYDEVFYKQRWINDNNLEQKLVVSFSLKTYFYQRSVRQKQVERASSYVDKPSKLKNINPNDPKRFIEDTHISDDGEVVERSVLSLNTKKIKDEEAYDGFYGVCTNLDADVSEIIKINKNRWQIEDSFRTLKTEFKTRPVYLQNENRIKAHFTTCFLSLLILRILEKKLNNQITTRKLINTLREMNFSDLDGKAYIPTFKRTDESDLLMDAFGFKMNTEIVDKKRMQKIIRETKTFKKEK